MTLIENANFILAVLTVLSQIFIVLSVVCLILFRGKYVFIENFFAKYGLLFAFITALVSMLASLFYSEIAGYTPCELCWYQRIVMYPQVLLLAIALYFKDKKIIKYLIALSIIGAVIALYHHLMQIGAISSLSCSAVGYSISCVQIFVMRFGYITLPLMAFTAFLQIIVLMLFSLKKDSNI